MDDIIDFRLLSISNSTNSDNSKAYVYFEVLDKYTPIIKKNYLTIAKLEKAINRLEFDIKSNEIEVILNDDSRENTNYERHYFSLTEQLEFAKDDLESLTNENNILIENRDRILIKIKNELKHRGFDFYINQTYTPDAESAELRDGEFSFKDECENKNLELSQEDIDKQNSKHILKIDTSNQNQEKILKDFFRVNNFKIIKKTFSIDMSPTKSAIPSYDTFYVESAISGSSSITIPKIYFIQEFNNKENRVKMFYYFKNHCIGINENIIKDEENKLRAEIKNLKQTFKLYEKFLAFFIKRSQSSYIKKTSHNFIEKFSDENGKLKPPYTFDDQRELNHNSSANINKLINDIKKENLCNVTTKLVLHSIYKESEKKGWITSF